MNRVWKAVAFTTDMLMSRILMLKRMRILTRMRMPARRRRLCCCRSVEVVNWLWSLVSTAHGPREPAQREQSRERQEPTLLSRPNSMITGGRPCSRYLGCIRILTLLLQCYEAV